VVDHAVLVGKLSCLPLPPCILNWLISFLSGRNHTTKTSAGESTPAAINHSIVQGSWLGPTLYLILESDLKPKSSINKIFKYADDTNLLVPELTDVDLCDEFMDVQNWAQTNKMIINMVKTKELVFRRPNPRLTLDACVLALNVSVRLSCLVYFLRTTSKPIRMLLMFLECVANVYIC